VEDYYYYLQGKSPYVDAWKRARSGGCVSEVYSYFLFATTLSDAEKKNITVGFFCFKHHWADLRHQTPPHKSSGTCSLKVWGESLGLRPLDSGITQKHTQPPPPKKKNKRLIAYESSAIIMCHFLRERERCKFVTTTNLHVFQ
jgi:hypothetical protein